MHALQTGMTVESALRAAVDLHRAGRLDEADAAYTRLLEHDPDHGPTLHMAGMLAFQRGDTVLAAGRLHRALTCGYRTGDVLEHYGLVLERQGDLGGAAASLRDSLVQAPASGSAWFNLGLIERRAGRLDTAIEAFGKAADLLAQAFAAFELGLTLQQAGRLEDAGAAYVRALDLDPADARSALNAGVVAQQDGDLVAAETLYHRALDVDPGCLAARINLASLLQAKGDLVGAETAYSVLLREVPEAIRAQNNLGLVLRGLGRDGEAEPLFRRALAQDALNAEAGANLAALLLDTGRGDEAVAARRSICEAHPDQPHRWLELARVLEAVGVHDEAEAALQRALTVEPGFAEAHTAAGDLAQHRRDWSSAIARYRRAAALAPARPEPQIGLALSALKGADADTALAACETLLARDRFDQSAIAYQALALRQAHQGAAADRLTDPDALVTVIDTGMEAGILAVLAADLKALPQRLAAPRGQSVRGGTQTAGELLAVALDSIRAFRAWLDDAIDAYLVDRPRDEEHPFFAARQGRRRSTSWSVVLRAGGYHVPHIHPEGWISGVFYVAVPSLDGPGEPGQLEFGPPGFELPLPSPPKRRLVEPAPGRLVLFPSYLWHGTRPFEGPGERITIAFDVQCTR